MSDKLLDAAVNAAGIINAVYEWMDRVEKAGGTTCISGVAECHAMLKSLNAQKPRINKLIMDPLLAEIERTKDECQD